MTFPSAVKKSGSVTIPKTTSGLKTLPPGSPRAPGSPLSPSPKVISGSVKTPMTTKASEKVNAVSSIATSVKKPLVPTKSPASKSVTKPINDANSEPAKIVVPVIKVETKTVHKPPPLKLNIKTTVTKGLLSPAANSKSVPKTPTTSSVKSPALAKSPMVIKPVSATRAPSVKSPSSPIIKSSQASTDSSPVNKSSQMTSGSKSSTTSSLVTKSSLTSKTLSVSSPTNKFPQVSSPCKSVGSSPVAKSPSTSVISKTSTMTSTVPKSPQSIKPSTSTIKSSVPSKTGVKDCPIVLKPVQTKDQATVKSTTLAKVTVSAKSEAGVKVTTTLSNKASLVSRSPAKTSSIKLTTIKIPTSPSKPLTKESISGKVSTSVKSTVINKSSATSKSGSTIPYVVKKESSYSSLLSVKSSSSLKLDSSVVSKTTLSTKVTSTSASKNLVPKSPVAKMQSLALSKSSSSPTAKTPSSPILKTRTPSTPTMKTPLLSTAKLPLSPVIKKMVPTKLVLSPRPPTKSLSSTRLGSVSTESLALKSPRSPKSTKVLTKNLSPVIKTIEKQKVKGIRGGQPIKKTIDIPGITRLSSNIDLNKQETDVEYKTESTAKNYQEEKNESITQITHQDSSRTEDLTVNETLFNIDVLEKLEMNSSVNDDNPLNVTITQNVDQFPDVQDKNVESLEKDSLEILSKLPILEQNQEEDIGNGSFVDFEVVEKKECEPMLTSITQSANNSDIIFDDGHFDTNKKNVIIEQLNETQTCSQDNDDHFEPMNDKLILGDVPFESDISDNEQTAQKETIETENFNAALKISVDDVFLPTESLSSIDFDRADSTEDFLHQFMPKSIERSEGTSSISTDDGSILSRKSYSEVVLGSSKDCEYYSDYDMVDDCLDYDDEERSVFVEVTEKEFPELKPKNVSTKRRRNKKQKKRNSNGVEFQSGK